MKKIVVTISLVAVQEAYDRISDNKYFRKNGEWASSNVWVSKEFDEYEDGWMPDEIEKMFDGIECGIKSIEA